MLFPDLEEAQLFPDADQLPHEFQRWCYLWTWTFADPVPRSDVRECMRRWSLHARWLRDSGKKLLRALERGSKGGAYHIHAITHERWDVNEIRANAEKHGFGRVNVKLIPREKVSYVAKYLGKPGRFPIPKGVRLWACIGYEGVRQNDVRCTIKQLTVNVRDLYPGMISVKRWTLDGQTIVEKLLRPDWNGDKAEIQIMNITKENVHHIATLVANGAILAIAEYRTCKGRTIEFDEKKKGVPTGKRLERKMVEHGVEIGTEQITVSQWLPDDADLEKIVAPAGKGEPVLVEIEQFSRQYGITAKSIRSLANFNGKLTQ